MGFVPGLITFLSRSFCVRVITGYLPSVVLLLSLYTVPPLMMRFSSIEGSISRSGRKTSACTKILFFNVWNVFFVNVLSGSVLNQLNVLTRPKDMPSMLAELVPKQVSMLVFFLSFFCGTCEKMIHWLYCAFGRQHFSSRMSSHQAGQVSAPRYCKCTT